MRKNAETGSTLVDTSLLVRAKEHISLSTSVDGPLDTLPVHMDIALGDNFNEIALDDAKIIERMHEEGFTDEQIAKMPIYISASVDRSEKNAFTFGMHRKEGKEGSSIHLYPNAFVETHVAFFKEVFRLAKPARDVTLSYTDSQGEASAIMSKSIYHEIRHARQHQIDTEMERAGRRYHAKYLTKFGAQALGISAISNGAGYIGAETLASGNFGAQLAIRVGAFVYGLVGLYLQDKVFSEHSFERYQANPVEIDARNAGEDAPDDVIRIAIKPSAMVVTHKAS